MSQENFELAKQGVAAISEAYANEDIAPWRRQVERVVDPELVLDAGPPTMNRFSSTAMNSSSRIHISLSTSI